MAIHAEPDLPPPGPWTAEGTALFLDLDGTLAPIERRPQDVRPEPWRSRLLQRLWLRLDGRLAVVSGRTLAEVDRILDGAAPAVAAVHGLVRRRADGTILMAAPHPALGACKAAFSALAAEKPGLILEDKGLSIALHYRLAPSFGAAVAATAERLSRAHGLRLQPGDMVSELLTPGLGKGGAVRAFMAEPPFEGALPIFMGDDLTDEDGFAAARALGGYGVLAGPPRATRASCRLPGVEAVRAWLEGGLERGAGR